MLDIFKLTHFSSLHTSGTTIHPYDYKFYVCFRIDLIHDIFGREKHKLHSENMGGVGSFDKDCRTLYVGRLGKHYDLESVLWSEFGEWGEIEVGKHG